MEDLASLTNRPFIFRVKQLCILVLLLVLKISYVVIYVVNVGNCLHLEQLEVSQFFVKGSSQLLTRQSFLLGALIASQPLNIDNAPLMINKLAGVMVLGLLVVGRVWKSDLLTPIVCIYEMIVRVTLLMRIRILLTSTVDFFSELGRQIAKLKLGIFCRSFRVYEKLICGVNPRIQSHGPCLLLVLAIFDPSSQRSLTIIVPLNSSIDNVDLFDEGRSDSAWQQFDNVAASERI